MGMELIGIDGWELATKMHAEGRLKLQWPPKDGYTRARKFAVEHGWSAPMFESRFTKAFIDQALASKENFHLACNIFGVDLYYNTRKSD